MPREIYQMRYAQFYREFERIAARPRHLRHVILNADWDEFLECANPDVIRKWRDWVEWNPEGRSDIFRSLLDNREVIVAHYRALFHEEADLPYVGFEAVIARAWQEGKPVRRTIFQDCPNLLNDIASGAITREDRPTPDTTTPAAELSREEFHRGRNLHGSAHDPRLGIHGSGDRSGFFTTASESHASFYANSEERNAEANGGDIYAALPPEHPVDFHTDWIGAARLIATYRRDAERMEDQYLDGRRPAGAGRLLRAVQEVTHALAHGSGAEIDSGLRNCAIEYGRLTGSEQAFDTTSLNERIRKLGYDAFVTRESDPTRHPPLPTRVTVYMDRPEVTSHRKEVERHQAALADHADRLIKRPSRR